MNYGHEEDKFLVICGETLELLSIDSINLDLMYILKKIVHDHSKSTACPDEHFEAIIWVNVKIPYQI
jgi:hypothetical protein